MKLAIKPLICSTPIVTYKAWVIHDSHIKGILVYESTC